MGPTQVFDLWYDDTLVGRISEAFISDATWFGTFEKATDEKSDNLTDRISEFIRFSVAWNERCQAASNAPDPSEFDQYQDLISSGLWSAKSADGTEMRLSQAPVFAQDNDISWSPAPGVKLGQNLRHGSNE